FDRAQFRSRGQASTAYVKTGRNDSAIAALEAARPITEMEQRTGSGKKGSNRFSPSIGEASAPGNLERKGKNGSPPFFPPFFPCSVLCPYGGSGAARPVAARRRPSARPQSRWSSGESGGNGASDGTARSSSTNPAAAIPGAPTIRSRSPDSAASAVPRSRPTGNSRL